MTTPRYRIGNDLTILWAICNRDGSPFNLDGKVVRLFVSNQREREEVEPIISSLEDGSTNNVIRWDFKGEDQKILGMYTLTVEIRTSEENKLIKKDYTEAFTLVGRSCSESEDEGEANINDGGDLYLSSKLDIYRFGIPKTTINTKGNWVIDGVDTQVSALGGGPGLVKEIYNENDFDKEFDADSVVDTFNASAIQKIRRQVSRVPEFSIASPMDDNVLIYKEGKWVNISARELFLRYATPSAGGVIDNGYWYVKDGILYTDMSVAVLGNLGVGGPGLGGNGEGAQVVTALSELTDVSIYNPKAGEILVYENGKWINKIFSVDIPVMPDLDGYATEAWVERQGYVKAADLTDPLSKIETFSDWFEWADEEHTTIRTKYNFFSQKQIAVGEKGEADSPASGGGITGIQVNGNIYNDADEFGIITIPNYPTELRWESVTGRPTKLTDFENDLDLSAYAGRQYVDDTFYTKAAAIVLSQGLTASQEAINKLNVLLEWFKYDSVNDAVYTDKSFYSKLQLAAGERGENASAGGGTITGIRVNGKDYASPDEYGILTIPDYPTSLNWDDITGKPTDLGQFTNEAGYIKDNALEGYATQGWVEAKQYALASNVYDKDAINQKEKDLSDRIALFEKWFREDSAGNLYTTYNFYSTKQLATGEAGAAHEGEGGGGRVNGIIINGTEYVEVDDYGNLVVSETLATLSDLASYLKNTAADNKFATKTYVNDTFATITSLGGVDARLKEIEEYFNGSGEDADNKINKWNEIVAFLNATEDTTLAGILAAYTLKTNHNALAERVTANEGAISGIITTLGSHTSTLSEHTTAINTLGSKVNPIDTWFNEVGKYFKKESDGVWYVDGSFYTKGQNAAGAVGSPDGGGSSGSGVMLLESWANVPSDLSGYALSAALGIELHERFNNYYTIGDVDNRFAGINSRLATLDSGMADRYTKAESDGRYLKTDGSNKMSAAIRWNDGHEGNDVADWDTVATETGLRIISSSTTTSHAPTTYATALHVKGRYGFQLASEGGAHDNFWIRNVRDKRDWKKLAFTDSNVASAQALKHSNGTVGATAQSSGLVSFASHIVPNNDSQAYVGVADKAWYAVYTNGLWAPSGKTLYLGANNSKHIIVNTSGNVAINNTLSVSSASTFSGLTTHNSGISTPHITIGGITLSVVDGVLRIDGNVYTTGQLGVGAVGQEGGGTGGGGVLLLNTWPTDGGNSYAGYALGGNLGIDLNTRVSTLEGKATAVSFSQTLTSGKQIGVLTIDGSSETLYAPSTYAWSEITSKPTTLSGYGITDALSTAGGTINGIITITHYDWRYGYIDFVDNRIGTEGYSDAIIRIVDANRDRHGALGLYGATSGIEYFYIGHNGYNGNNLRVYKDKVTFGVNTLLHSGNVGEYTLEYEVSPTPRLNTFGLWHTVGAQLYVGYSEDYFMQFYVDSSGLKASYKHYNLEATGKTIAFTDSNVASATKLATARTIWGQSFDGTGNVDGNISTSGEVFLNHNKAIRMKGSNGTDYNVLFTSGTDLNIGYDSPVIRFGGSKMFINSSGNVTMGGSDLAGTSAKLAVNGDVRIQNNTTTNGDSPKLYLSGLTASDGNVTGPSLQAINSGYYGRKRLAFFQHNADNYTTETEVFSILPNGNVGIGTTAPKSKLHVSGDLRIYGDAFFFDSSGNNRITFTHASDIARIYNNGNSTSMYIGEYNGNALSIVANNIGIGTKTPTYKLDVAGSIRTTSSLTIGTIVLTDENGTLKIAGNAYATGQLATGEAGQATSGGGSVILDYDSIVGALGFTPASSSQLTTLSNRVATIERKQQWELDSNGVAFTTDAGMVVPLGTPHILGLDDAGQCDLTVGDSSYVTRLYGSSILANGSEVLTKANTSFTRNYNSGTKIGTIKIGGTSTDIYVPASGSSSLWTTEYDMTVGADVLVSSKEYIGTNTIVGWDSAGSCVNDLYIGYDGYTIWMQGSVDEASDMRLKTVIDAVNLDIRDIAFAPIFNYVFKSRPQGRQMLGSSAQYWQTIAPCAVSENDKGNLAMNYGAIALASVVAVAKKTLTHEEEIANLKLEVQDLKQKLARYELN